MSHIQTPGLFSTSDILTILPNICGKAFDENNVNSFLNYFKENEKLWPWRDQSQEGRIIVQHSGIFRHNQAHPGITQENSNTVRSMPNFGMTRTLKYSESWHMWNPGIFRTRTIFRTLIYSGLQTSSQPCQTSAMESFTKITQIVFRTIFKYSETSHNNV